MAARADAPSLDAASLVAAAEEKTGGLTDFGDPTFVDRLEILSQMLEEARLSPAGRVSAQDQVTDLLANRLRFANDRKRYPGIEEERIERPLIITGLARSGTTFLHSLLAEDPGSRAPRSWEVRHPSPPPGLAKPDDPRIAETNEENERYLAQIPGLLQAHPYSDKGAHALSECEGWMALDLRNTFPNSFYRVPAMLTSRPLSTDFYATYAFHRAFLQHLQFGAPPRRWALKGTQHHYHLEELRATYPDAIVLWIHRDPARVLPSMLELVALIQQGITGRVNRPRLASYIVAAIEADLARVLDSPMLDDPGVVHVRYHDLRADPVATVRDVYQRSDLSFMSEFEERIRTWPERNPVDRHGAFEYSPEAFELAAEDLGRRFAPYRERFGIPSEESATTDES